MEIPTKELMDGVDSFLGKRPNNPRAIRKTNSVEADTTDF